MALQEGRKLTFPEEYKLNYLNHSAKTTEKEMQTI